MDPKCLKVVYGKKQVVVYQHVELVTTRHGRFEAFTHNFPEASNIDNHLEAVKQDYELMQTQRWSL